MTHTILLAEDNEDDVFFFKTAAKKAGWIHNLHTVSNGREAIQSLRNYLAGDLPRLALVLLDMKMPFIGGLEVLEWAQTQPELHFIPFVMLTSSEQESDIEAAYRLGAASFLVKPSQSEKLLELLRVIDAYWLNQNRLPAMRRELTAKPPSFS